MTLSHPKAEIEAHATMFMYNTRSGNQFQYEERVLLLTIVSKD